MSRFIIERAERRAGPWVLVAGKAEDGASEFHRAEDARHYAHQLWFSGGEQRQWFRVRGPTSWRAVHVFHGGRYVHQVGANGTDFGWVRAHH